MTAPSTSRFLYRLIRKILVTQIVLIRKALIAQNKFRINYECPGLTIPLCVSTGYNSVYWKKSWKTDVIERLVNANDGLFIDVGANLGQTLLDLIVVHPMARYVGFEPNVACVFYLKELILANSFDRCLIVPAGLTDETRCLSLYRSKYIPNDSAATIVSDLRPDKLCHIDFVPCFRFDEIRHSLSGDNINFVKIDIEGSELESLVGMRKSLQECRPLILCEVLFTDSKANLARHKVRNDQLMQFLRDLGYEVLQLVKSSDDRHVVDAKKIRRFTSAYHTLDNKDYCDYLFIPEEKEEYVLNALLKAHSAE
jgi:FkbM family methyltransferase